MVVKKKIEVDYLARIEGETSIIVKLDGDADVKLKIFEPLRFLEGFLAGRKFDDVGDIVSRICGICPVSRMTTAIQAVENAAGIEVTPQTGILRKIMSISQIVAGHLIHLYMLAKRVVKDVSQFDAPDFHSESEYVALDSDGEYAVNEGKISCSVH